MHESSKNPVKRPAAGAEEGGRMAGVFSSAIDEGSTIMLRRDGRISYR
jgi:hypothetical protein